MLAIDRGELIGDDGVLHYSYNVGDEGPSSVRIAAAGPAVTTTLSTYPRGPAVSSAPFPHPIQSYLSDGGLTPRAHAAADYVARSPEGLFQGLNQEGRTEVTATGHREAETPRRGEVSDAESGDYSEEEEEEEEVVEELDEEDEEEEE